MYTRFRLCVHQADLNLQLEVLLLFWRHLSTTNLQSVAFIFTLFFKKHVVIMNVYFILCGALRDLVAFAQFKKLEKHPWRSVTFSKLAGVRVSLWKKLQVSLFLIKLQSVTKSDTPPWVFFLNCTNGTKSHKASHMHWECEPFSEYRNLRVRNDSMVQNQRIWIKFILTIPTPCISEKFY